MLLKPQFLFELSQKNPIKPNSQAKSWPRAPSPSRPRLFLEIGFYWVFLRQLKQKLRFLQKIWDSSSKNWGLAYKSMKTIINTSMYCIGHTKTYDSSSKNWGFEVQIQYLLVFTMVLSSGGNNCLYLQWLCSVGMHCAQILQI